jgi:hypothetical protein
VFDTPHGNADASSSTKKDGDPMVANASSPTAWVLGISTVAVAATTRVIVEEISKLASHVPVRIPAVLDADLRSVSVAVTATATVTVAVAVPPLDAEPLPLR